MKLLYTIGKKKVGLTMKTTGSCLCKKVTITLEHLPTSVTACHCSMCRKWTSGPFLSIEGGPSDKVKIEPENAISRYQSSEWAERGFCSTCGSSLFYHGFDDDIYYFPIDLFESNQQTALTEEIFYDRKPAYYSFANQTKKLTEADILAAVKNELEE